MLFRNDRHYKIHGTTSPKVLRCLKGSPDGTNPDGELDTFVDESVLGLSTNHADFHSPSRTDLINTTCK